MSIDPRGENRKPIIVIEDNDALRLALVDFLNVRGFIAAGFDGVESYLSVASDLQASIIISDVYLGDGTAFDMINRMSQNDLYVPVILMSGSVNPNLERLALENGACAFFQKPFAVANMIAAINEFSQ